MRYIDLFPTVLFFEELKDLKLNLYKNFLSKLDMVSDGPNGSVTKSHNVLDTPIYKKLKEIILEKSSSYLKELGFKHEKVCISNSWGNIVNLNEFVHKHIHPNSYISGCIYLTQGSPVEFFNPLSEKYTFLAQPILPVTHRTRKTYSITPSPGMLLIWPSWLYHQVLPSSNNNRMSIAFNIIPKGEFGGYTTKLYL